MADSKNKSGNGLTLSKRGFLSATTAAGVTASVPSRSFANNHGDVYDLIVVGGGNSGLPTAIFAAQRDARVLIIEAASELGGTLFLSTGQMSAAGTKLQKSKGIEDTPQSHYDDVMRISKGTADPDLVHLAVFNAAETFDWLTDNGFKARDGHPVTGTTHEPYSEARYAWGPEGGLSILKVLEEQLKPYLENGKVTALTSTEAIKLIQEPDGTVIGVTTKDVNGQTARQLGKHVVLTCGGYASNSEMFEELEGATDYADVSYPYSQGAGITLGLGAGGYVRGGEDHLPLFGAILADDDYPSPAVGMVRHFPPNRPPWEIYVNIKGERFLREDIPSHDAYEHGLLNQPEERCWVMFDDAIFKAAPKLVGGFPRTWTQEEVVEAFADDTPMFYKANTIQELAKKAGINPDGLQNTVGRYNEGQATGKDPLGRKYMPLPIVKPPYYAIRLQSWLLTTYAGLAVNGELNVIRQDGTPIPNLYAAGELLGGGQLFGRAVIGGMMVTPALTFGRLLGQRLITFGA